MSYVNINTANAAPASQEMLKQIHAAFGATPNMFKAVSNSPAALKSMWGSFGALGAGTLGAKLGEQIAVAVAIETGAPVRASNLAAIRLGENLIKPGGPGTPYWLVFPGYDVKSSFMDGAVDHYSASLPEFLLAVGGLAIAFTMTTIGVRSPAISRRFKAMASACPRSSASRPGYAPGVSTKVRIGRLNFSAMRMIRIAFR